MTKFEMALLLVPSDLLSEIYIAGAEAAFAWTGVSPKASETFYFDSGTSIARQRAVAWDKELVRRVNADDCDD